MDFKNKIEMIIGFFENLCGVCDQFESVGVWNEEVPLRKMFTLEYAAFMMYLSASDGCIHDNEAKLIYAITGYDQRPEEIEAFVERENIYSEEFEERTPTIFAVACEFERICYANGLDPKKQSFVEQFFMLYKLTGELLLEIDGEVSDDEYEDLNIYMNNIEQFIKSYD